jgi:hypothetical protein
MRLAAVDSKLADDEPDTRMAAGKMRAHVPKVTSDDDDQSEEVVAGNRVL